MTIIWKSGKCSSTAQPWEIVSGHCQGPPVKYTPDCNRQNRTRCYDWPVLYIINYTLFLGTRGIMGVQKKVLFLLDLTITCSLHVSNCILRHTLKYCYSLYYCNYQFPTKHIQYWLISYTQHPASLESTNPKWQAWALETNINPTSNIPLGAIPQIHFTNCTINNTYFK